MYVIVNTERLEICAVHAQPELEVAEKRNTKLHGPVSHFLPKNRPLKETRWLDSGTYK